jgi:hypothetical protein
VEVVLRDYIYYGGRGTDGSFASEDSQKVAVHPSGKVSGKADSGMGWEVTGAERRDWTVLWLCSR